MVLSCNQVCMLLAVATKNIGKGRQRVPRGRCRQFERKRCTRCALNLSHLPDFQSSGEPSARKAAQKGGLGAVFYCSSRSYFHQCRQSRIARSSLVQRATWSVRSQRDVDENVTFGPVCQIAINRYHAQHAIYVYVPNPCDRHMVW